MRIRKYANLSSLQLLPPPSHLSGVDDRGGQLLQPYVCQLNQSPWDAPDSFLPLPIQYQREDSFTGTVNSLNDSAPMQESFPDELEPEEERRKKEKLVFKRKKVLGAGTTTKRKTRKGGGSLGNYDNATVMKGGEAAGTLRRKKKGATSNPHEFYYYTGFGPSWRKRGAIGEDGNFNSATDSVSSITGPAAYTTPYLVNKFGIAVKGDNGIDIVEEDEDDDGGESSAVGKKQMRKPIKARSLKSLM